MPYFDGHNDKTFFSFFTEDELLLHGQTTIDEKRLVGVLTSRPARIIKGGETLDAYYCDYLCVDQMRRKRGHTQKLIKTHEYGQRHLNQKISVSLFKREDELSHLVPLTIYKTYGFQLNANITERKLNPMYKFLTINASNYRLLNEFIEEQTQFEIRIQADVANTLALLQTGNIFLYAIALRDQIVCAYFFRKSCVFVDSEREVLSCFASINRDDAVFIDGFYYCLQLLSKSFGYLAIEDISNNDELIAVLGAAEIVSPTAYYFHNYVCKTIDKQKVFINI